MRSGKLGGIFTIQTLAICLRLPHQGQTTMGSSERLEYFDTLPSDNCWILGPHKSADDQYESDVWAFSRCQRVTKVLRPLQFDVDQQGEVTDFNATVFGAIVVSERCKEMIRGVCGPADIEFLAADVSGAIGRWHVANLLACVDCLDHTLSKIRYYDEQHPRKPGKPRSVERIVLRSHLIAERHLFRLADWPCTVIASDFFKSRFESEGLTGIEFHLVSS
ncbi:DUF1629 domain-containing protein [Botrimarina sp.]|uniref:imm11 family protein n=1 Tax=Botrimarina sp. TaxID=2795802 RepID=UPI0032ED8CDE